MQTREPKEGKVSLAEIRTQEEVVGDSLKGDTESIAMFTDAFLKIVGNYAVEMKMTRLDLFLGIHNLHKLVVADIARVWAADSVPLEKTYRLADVQFHQAMRELTYPTQGGLSRKQRRKLVANSKKD